MSIRIRLSMRNKKKNRKLKKTSFLKNVVILVVAHVFIKIIGIVNKIYLTNREGFGDAGNAIYSSAFQVYALFLTITSVGIPNAVSKLVSERLAIGDSKGAHKVFKVAVISFGMIGFLASLILFKFSHYITCNLIQIPEAELSLLALSPSIFFVAITSAVKGYFNGRENLNVGASSQTIEQIFKTIITIVLIEIIAQTTGLDTRVMAAGTAVATTLSEITCFMYLFKYYTSVRKEVANEIKHSVNYTYRGIRRTIKDILNVSIPMSIAPILGGINKNIDSMTIVRSLKNFMTETEAKLQYGILSGKVDTIVAFPLSFNSAFSSVLIPAVSAARASGNFEYANKKIKFSMLISLLIGVPSTVGMIVLAEPILHLLFPNQPDGAFLLQISSISITFIMLSQNINAVLHGIGKIVVPAISLVIGLVIKLILNNILVGINPDIFVLGGTAGAATSTVICHIITFGIELSIMNKYVKVDLRLSHVLKILLSTLMMGITSGFILHCLKAFFVEKICMILTIIAAIIIYILLILIFKVFSVEEIKAIPCGEKIYIFLKKIKLYE